MCRLYIITYYIRYPVSDTPRYAIAPQWSVQCFLGCSVTLLSLQGYRVAHAAMVCAVFPWVQRHAAAASAGAGGLGNTPGVRNTLCLAIYLAFLLRQKKSKNMPRVTMVSKIHFKNCT